MAGLLDFLFQQGQGQGQPQPQQGGLLTRMGDALIGMGDPYGMSDPNQMDPRARQMAIGQALMNIGTGISSSKERNPVAAVGQGFQHASQQGMQQGQARMQGDLFRQQIADRKRKAEAQKKISEVLADPNRRGELPSILAEYDAGAAANLAIRGDERKDDREWRDKQAAEDRAFRMQMQGMSFGQQKSLLEMKQKMEAQGGGQFSNQPIYVTDSEGRVRVMQLNQNGQAILTQLPEGVNIAPNLIKVETGTGTDLTDPRTGLPKTHIPKDIVGQKSQEAVGKAQGEARVAAPAAIATAEETLKLLDQIENHPSLNAAVGVEANLPDFLMAPAGSGARDFIAMLEQAQGGAFLQAFETLKGGGQITQVEGEKATKAIARMQRSQSEKEFRAAINDYRSVVRAGLDRARKGIQVAPGGQGQPAPQSAPLPSPSVDDLINKYAPR